MGELLTFPAHRIVKERALSVRELALAIGFSKRWIQYRVAEGMPHDRLANGELRFFLSEVKPWIKERESA